MSQQEDILTFIRDELLDDDELELTADTSLFQDRVLESLNLLALINHLEKTYNIKVKNSEVNIDNLDTVTRMMAFLEGK